MPRPWTGLEPTAAHRASYADAVPRSFWLDDLPSRRPLPPADGTIDADLCVVGGGYTGLWAALHALRDDPGRSVVVLESGSCGAGASGRNGGFVDASLTHGLANGAARFAGELDVLERLGRENLAGLAADLERHGIDAELERPGELIVALEDRELPGLAEEADLLGRHGHDVELLDAGAVRARVDSPTYAGALLDRTGAALVHPGKLAGGLLAAALAAGARVHEHTPVTRLRRDGAGVLAITPHGARIRARRVLVATGGYRGPVPAIRRYVAPVYDYVLVSEPLTHEQRGRIGWHGGEGISDAGNQFHYYRLTRDGRILFGGYDAVYRFGNAVGPQLDEHDPTFARLALHLFTTFPQLEGLRFSHRWGGVIDTCSRFSVFFGTTMGGRVAYAAGYTGLGVAASRFGARVALDLLDGRDTEATRLRYVARRPVPFPPEPLRTGVIRLTQNRLAAADRRGGRRGLWLRALDRAGLGFDS